jgi:hypothetical protein
MRDMRNAYTILTANPEIVTRLERPRCRCDDGKLILERILKNCGVPM